MTFVLIAQSDSARMNVNKTDITVGFLLTHCVERLMAQIIVVSNSLDCRGMMGISLSILVGYLYLIPVSRVCVIKRDYYGLVFLLWVII